MKILRSIRRVRLTYRLVLVAASLRATCPHLLDNNHKLLVLHLHSPAAASVTARDLFTNMIKRDFASIIIATEWRNCSDFTLNECTVALNKLGQLLTSQVEVTFFVKTYSIMRCAASFTPQPVSVNKTWTWCLTPAMCLCLKKKFVVMGSQSQLPRFRMINLRNNSSPTSTSSMKNSSRMKTVNS